MSLRKALILALCPSVLLTACAVPKSAERLDAQDLRTDLRSGVVSAVLLRGIVGFSVDRFCSMRYEEGLSQFPDCDKAHQPNPAAATRIDLGNLERSISVSCNPDFQACLMNQASKQYIRRAAASAISYEERKKLIEREYAALQPVRDRRQAEFRKREEQRQAQQEQERARRQARIKAEQERDARAQNLFYSLSREPKKVGETICSPDNRIGFVERVEGTRIQISLHGQGSPYGWQRYQFFMGTMNVSITDISSRIWDDSIMWARCDYRLTR